MEHMVFFSLEPNSSLSVPIREVTEKAVQHSASQSVVAETTGLSLNKRGSD